MYGCLHCPAPLPAPDALVVLARDFTPRVEASEPTPVLLDLQGLGRLWSEPAELGRALLEAGRARGLVPNVALGWTRSAVRTLARGRSGLVVVAPGGEAEALAPLGLEALPLSAERLTLFRRWGLRTLGDLARLPPAELGARLGPEGPRLVRLARGEDEAPFVSMPAVETFEVSLEVEWPVEGIEPLTFLLSRLLEPLAARLVSRGRRAAALTLNLGLVDGSADSRTLRPAAPSAEARTWRTLLVLALESEPPRDAVLSLHVRVEPTESRSVQFSLLDPAQPSPEKLALTLGRLEPWMRDGRSGSPALLDTHRPGAFAVATFAPGPASALGARSALPSPKVALRAFRPPRPADVLLRSGAPVFVSASGIRGAVVDRAGPWRASGDWWDVAWSREEWDVSLGPTGCYRIFRDRQREAWFVEGELD